VVDITAPIKAARDRADAWSWDRSVAAIRSFADHNGLTLDWDQGAGEAWARLIDAGRPVALLWTRIPFGFVDPRAIELKRVLRQAAIEFVELPDFDEPILRLDIRDVEPVVDASRWPDAVVPARLSASDLWWATV